MATSRDRSSREELQFQGERDSCEGMWFEVGGWRFKVIDSTSECVGDNMRI